MAPDGPRTRPSPRRWVSDLSLNASSRWTEGPAGDLTQAFARLAIGSILLSAVADRFGAWGPYGAPNVSWGDFGHFITYTAKVNSFVPAFAPSLAVVATIFETLFGIALIAGICTRIMAIGSACLFAVFGAAMMLSLGIKAPLNFSVFTDCAAALLLSGVPRYRWSIDALFATGRFRR
ncbi:MAG: DoxX family membrane protein [Candidatus Eremiobacteraeota bacterium]|nr:DoxX family membrane protein [Candidatus Eremiobacteraeota bacterium]